MELTSSFSLFDEVSHLFLKQTKQNKNQTIQQKSDSCILVHNFAVVSRLFLSDRVRMPGLPGFGLLHAQVQTWWAAVLNHPPHDSCLHSSSRNSAFSLEESFQGEQLHIPYSHRHCTPLFLRASNTSLSLSPEIFTLAGARSRGQRWQFPKRSIISVRFLNTAKRKTFL